MFLEKIVVNQNKGSWRQFFVSKIKRYIDRK